jgi:hypothetical protein
MFLFTPPASLLALTTTLPVVRQYLAWLTLNLFLLFQSRELIFPAIAILFATFPVTWWVMLFAAIMLLPNPTYKVYTTVRDFITNTPGMIGAITGMFGLALTFPDTPSRVMPLLFLVVATQTYELYTHTQQLGRPVMRKPMPVWSAPTSTPKSLGADGGGVPE